MICASGLIAATGFSTGFATTAEAFLEPAEASIGARVGASVGVDNNTLVLGAPNDDEAGPFAGAAFIYERTAGAWHRSAKLLGPATDGFRAFGESVAISGDVVVIGAPFDGPYGHASGAVYIYERVNGQWMLHSTITPTDPAVNQQFGDAVAIEKTTIVVGAFLDSTRGSNTGAAYVFARSGDTWSQRAKLTASDASNFAFFGSAVAVNGKNVVVGAPTAETAYLFTKSGDHWIEQAILTAFDASSDYTAFGAAVAMDKSIVAIGAPLAATSVRKAGAVYVFENSDKHRSTQHKLTTASAMEEDEFGTAVAMHGHHLAVGSPYHGDFNEGAVYLFRASGKEWQEISLFTGDPSTAFLGAAVDLEKDTLAAGAPSFVDFTGTRGIGAGYVFRTR